MRKSKHSDTATSGDDDVAGLFKRLGADADAVYRDFGNDRLRPPPPLPPAAPAPAAQPAPAAAPASPAPLASAVPPVRPVAPGAPAPASSGQAPAPAQPAAPALDRSPADGMLIEGVRGAPNPLQQLFDRLAGAATSPANESPLRRLRGS